MFPLRLLVVEGDTAEGRALTMAAGGETPSEGYVALLHELLPEATIDICYPTDRGSHLPDRRGIEDYDGVAITGSGLNIYNHNIAVMRQIELTRAVLAARTPLFGSCWGLQVITVAAGGTVRKNPKGRETGFARRIVTTAAGRHHPMYAGKDDVFDAVTIHMDEVETLAPGMQVLATNTMSEVQAAELRTDGAVAWAVQYHPEYSIHDLAAIVRRYDKQLIDEGLFSSQPELLEFTNELECLHCNPNDTSLARRHGVDRAVIDKTLRVKEISNWITHEVMASRTKRGRA